MLKTGRHIDAMYFKPVFVFTVSFFLSLLSRSRSLNNRASAMCALCMAKYKPKPKPK